jgi:hypothetical protein
MKTLYFTKFILPIVLLFGAEPAVAQHTVIWGAITDAKSHTPLSYVTVAIPGTENGSNRYYLSQSNLKMDFGLNKKKGVGVLGERLVVIDDLKFNQPRPDSIYSGPAVAFAATATDRKVF